jgi:hypothetical protein
MRSPKGKPCSSPARAAVSAGPSRCVARSHQALPLIARSEPDAGLLLEGLMAAATLNGGEARNRAQAFLEGKAAKAMPATGIDEERGAR